MPTDGANRLTKRLRHMNPGAPLWRAAEDNLDANALLSAEGDATERRQPAGRDGHAPTMITVTPTISARWR